MDNQKIDQNVYERYVDATVALFMEYYSAARVEDIHTMLADDERPGMEFPGELDVRCRTLIKKEHARHQRKQYWKTAMKGLRFAASFAVVLLALSSVLFLTVDAIRIPIINYYIENSDGYWEITSRDKNERSQNGGIDAEDPLKCLLADEYELTALDDHLPKILTAIYVGPEENKICFSIERSTGLTRIDSEDAQVTQECQIAGREGFVVVKDGRVTVIWGDEEVSQIFSLVATGLSEAEVIEIAEQFMQVYY